MTYSINQDTRYQDRFNIVATNFAGQSKIVATVRGAQVQAKLNQLQYPYGC